MSNFGNDSDFKISNYGQWTLQGIYFPKSWWRWRNNWMHSIREQLRRFKTFQLFELQISWGAPIANADSAIQWLTTIHIRFRSIDLCTYIVQWLWCSFHCVHSSGMQEWSLKCTTYYPHSMCLSSNRDILESINLLLDTCFRMIEWNLSYWFVQCCTSVYRLYAMVVKI